MGKQHEKGGVALEYILVSTFAVIATTMVLGALTSVTKQKLSKIAEKFDVNVEFADLNFFEN